MGSSDPIFLRPFRSVVNASRRSPSRPAGRLNWSGASSVDSLRASAAGCLLRSHRPCAFPCRLHSIHKDGRTPGRVERCWHTANSRPRFGRHPPGRRIIVRGLPGRRRIVVSCYSTVDVDGPRESPHFPPAPSGFRGWTIFAGGGLRTAFWRPAGRSGSAPPGQSRASATTPGRSYLLRRAIERRFSRGGRT